MKRAFVILLFAFMLASTTGPALAASDLSPFHGLTFDDPVSTFADIEVRRVLNLDTGSAHEIIWGCYTLSSYGGFTISILYMETPHTDPDDEYYYDDYYNDYYDAFKVGDDSSTGPIVERGPIESLAGLPAFYTISEISVNGVVTRGIIWYILCEGRMFQVITSHVDTPSMLTYSEQQEKMFDDFLKSLGATSELKPGVINGGDGGSSGGSDGGDGGSDGGSGFGGGSSSSGGGGGGCNAFGGVLGLSALVIASALKRTKKA